MRISDWSSDVCSSDLLALVDQHRERGGGHRLAGRSGLEDRLCVDGRALAELAHAPAARQRRLAILDDRDRHAGRADFLAQRRSEEHTSELQSLMRISYAVFCLKKKTKHNTQTR